MRLVFAGLKHDYGKPERGLGYEYYNVVEPLLEMAQEVVLVDTGVARRGVGRRGLNRALVRAVEEAEPDALFTFLFEDEVSRRTLDHVRTELGVPTVNWFADDHWRFEDFTSRYAPHLDWSVTTSAGALPKYRALGVRNVVKSQWACNPFRYRPVPGPLEHDVSFVGQPHGNRRAVVEALRRRGIEVSAWGQGWPNGRIGQDGMVRLFGATRVNLNLSNSSTVRPLPRWQRRLFAGVGRLRLPPPALALGRRVLGAVRPPPPEEASLDPPPGLTQQIKGRNFEIPACGGFQLTEEVEDLASCYAIGREVACYRDFAGLVEQIERYLGNEEERRRVAQAGHRRTLAEHTWFHRFEALFSRMGIPCPSAREVLARGPAPGKLTEVFP